MIIMCYFSRSAAALATASLDLPRSNRQPTNRVGYTADCSVRWTAKAYLVACWFQ